MSHVKVGNTIVNYSSLLHAHAATTQDHTGRVTLVYEDGHLATFDFANRDLANAYVEDLFKAIP